jgi:hypothetical protein
MGQSLREAVEELEQIANRRSSARQRLDETRDEFRRRFDDYLYRAYGVRDLPPPDDRRRRKP